MDPNMATRKVFTQSFTERSCPAGAAERYQELFKGLQKMLLLLANHEAMRPNMDRPYSEPAVSKTKVYFMWDFVGRTLGLLARVDPKLPNTPAVKAQLGDIEGRVQLADMLIRDRDGKLEMMMGPSGDREDGVEFGSEIETASSELVED